MVNDEKLTKSIKELVQENKKITSLKNNFLRGIVFGLGSAIGASVIAAIVIAAIFKSFETLKNLFVR